MKNLFTRQDLELMLELTTKKMTRIDARLKKTRPGSLVEDIAKIDKSRLQTIKDKISDLLLNY